MNRRIVIGLFSFFFALSSIQANDTVFVSGGLQHDGLLDWTPVMYHSNSYADIDLHWQTERGTFRELRAKTRLEMNQWPMPGYEADFAGHGIGHLSVAAAFTWGEITVGDVYGQFGSGLILNLYEDRALGIDGALRGAKIVAQPYKGIRLTALGGKHPGRGQADGSGKDGGADGHVPVRGFLGQDDGNAQARRVYGVVLQGVVGLGRQLRIEPRFQGLAGPWIGPEGGPQHAAMLLLDKLPVLGRNGNASLRFLIHGPTQGA